jgi:uncharacterized protein YndB with AHSA1/START domain
VESTTERLALTRELEIDASPETVWELLVDPVKMTRWMGMSATLEARPGGVYHCNVVPGHTAVGEVIEVDPPRRLVHTWGWEEGGSVAPGSTTVEYELVPSGSGTLLRFTHRDLPGADSVESHGHGWDHYFERLRVVAAGGDAGVDPWITERSS